MLLMALQWYEKLKARREELKWSPGQLSRLARVSRPQILDIEAGAVRYPRRETIMALCESLGLDYEWLYSSEESGGAVRDTANDYAAQLEGVDVNLLAIKEMDKEEFVLIARQLAERREKLERERREMRNAQRRRSKAAKQAGQADQDQEPPQR
jgi:transcriptional regulator with XRE-family HTH domain